MFQITDTSQVPSSGLIPTQEERFHWAFLKKRSEHSFYKESKSTQISVNKTIKALISWANHYEAKEGGERILLRSEGKKGVEFLAPASQRRFFRVILDKICAFFGIGGCSLQKVATIVRKALEKRDHVFSKEETKGLQKAVLLLNQKIFTYNSRKLFGYFRMPRAKILDHFSTDRNLNMKRTSLEILREKDHSPTEMGMVRRGISNEGNTCFAAATLQALFPFKGLFNHEVFRSFYDGLARVSEREVYPKEGINEFLNSLPPSAWSYKSGAEDDPVQFLEEAIMPHLGKSFSWKRVGCDLEEPAILRQKIQRTTPGSSLQQILSGEFLKKPFQIVSKFPAFFVINIDGRRLTTSQGEEYKDTPVSVDYALKIKGEEGKRETYHLAAVVMYASHHYYTLEPHFGEHESQPIFWTMFNDSSVSRVSHSQELARELGTGGYLFFYRASNP